MIALTHSSYRAASWESARDVAVPAREPVEHVALIVVAGMQLQQTGQHRVDGEGHRVELDRLHRGDVVVVALGQELGDPVAPRRPWKSAPIRYG